MTDEPTAPMPAQPGSAPTGPAPAPAATPGSWPSSATMSVAFVTVIAIAAIIAAIVGFSQSSSSDDDNAAIKTELDAASARATAAEQERDALVAQVDQSESAIATLTDERDEAVATEDTLTSDLAAETERADAAEGVLEELEAVVGQFPISLDSSLIADDMQGTYAISYAEAFCGGFTTCGTLPTVSEATIYKTTDGFLRVEVAGILDAGLFALDGSLYGITDSLTALPPCKGIETRARVTITMYAGSITVADDGVRTVNDVNASITVDATPEDPECPSGLVFYASSFTPLK